jgi:hypothetical protein
MPCAEIGRVFLAEKYTGTGKQLQELRTPHGQPDEVKIEDVQKWESLMMVGDTPGKVRMVSTSVPHE